MICSDPECKLVLKGFETSGGNDLCAGHRIQKIVKDKRKRRMEKSKFMSDEDRKKFLTPDEIIEFYGPKTLKEEKISW